MKQRDRRKKIAQKRQMQKAAKDKHKPEKATHKPIVLTRQKIENTIVMYETYAEADASYIDEEQETKRNMLLMIVVASVALLCIGGYIFEAGLRPIGKLALAADVFVLMVLALRYRYSHESLMNWQESHSRHARYAKEWKIRLRDHDAGAQIILTPYMMR